MYVALSSYKIYFELCFYFFLTKIFNQCWSFIWAIYQRNSFNSSKHFPDFYTFISIETAQWKNTCWMAVITCWQMKQRSFKTVKEQLSIIQQLKKSRTKCFVRQEGNLSVLLLSLVDSFWTCFLEHHLFLEGHCRISSAIGSHITEEAEWLLFLAKEKLQHNIKQTNVWAKDDSTSCCYCSWLERGDPAAQHKKFNELGKYQLQRFRGMSLVALNTHKCPPKEGLDVLE